MPDENFNRLLLRAPKFKIWDNLIEKVGVSVKFTKIQASVKKDKFLLFLKGMLQKLQTHPNTARLFTEYTERGYGDWKNLKYLPILHG